MPTICVLGSLNTDLVTLTRRIPEPGETLHALSFHTGPGGKGANQAVACARACRSRPPPPPPPQQQQQQPSEQPASAPGQQKTTLASPLVPSTAAPLQDDDIKVRMLGAVGNDAFGPLLVAALSAQAVDTTHVRTLDGASTGTATILVEADSGENRILVVPGANWEGWPPKGAAASQAEDWQSAASDADLLVLQLEVPLHMVCSAASQTDLSASARQRQVLLNPAPCPDDPAQLDSLRRLLRSVHHLVLNAGEAQMLVFVHPSCEEPDPDPDRELEAGTDTWLDAVFHYLRAWGARHVVVTLGADGAAFGDCSQSQTQLSSSVAWRRCPAERVEKVVDTTGAGDTFVGAYAVEVVRAVKKGRFDMARAVKRACSAAARSVQAHGAWEGMPFAGEY